MVKCMCTCACTCTIDAYTQEKISQMQCTPILGSQYCELDIIAIIPLCRFPLMDISIRIHVPNPDSH